MAFLLPHQRQIMRATLRVFHDVAHWCSADERRRRRQQRYVDLEAERPSLLVFGPGHEVKNPTDDEVATVAAARGHRPWVIAGAMLVVVLLGATVLARVWNRHHAGAAGQAAKTATTPTSVDSETSTDSAASAPPAARGVLDETGLVAASTVKSDSTLNSQRTEQGSLAPVLLEQVLPEYPAEAGRKGLAGLVVITYALDLTGQPTDLLVVESVPGIDEAAIAALRKWRYLIGPDTDLTRRYEFRANFVQLKPRISSEAPTAAWR